MAKSYFKQEHDLGISLLIIFCVSISTSYFLILSLFSEDNCVFIWLEKRRAEAARIREKYPDRIPVRI